jgi:hypothetical protein
MPSIAEQLAAAPVTDPLTLLPSEEAWPKLPWAVERGTFSGSGWKPPGYSAASAPTYSQGGTYYKAAIFSGGAAFAYLTIPTAYSLVKEEGATEDRKFSVWVFADVTDATADGYQLQLRQASTGTGAPNLYKFRLRKFVAGAATLLEETGTVTIEVGGAFALSVRAGKLTMWRREGALTPWGQVGAELTDATFTSGYSAIDGDGSNPTLTNFATGTLGPDVETFTALTIPPQAEPPTRLAISLLEKDGETVDARWGPDESDVANVPKGLQFSTADPGLFKDASLSLARRIDADWPDLVQLRPLRIHGVGRRIAWEGRLHEIPSHHAEDFAISPTAVGHAAALDDDPTFREIYIGRDLQEWTDIAAQRRLNYGTTFSYAGFSVAPDSQEGRPSLAMEVDGHWEGQIPSAGAMLDAGAGCAIAALDYDFALSTSDANFTLELNSSPNDASSGLEGVDLATGATTGSGTYAPAVARRVVAAFWRYALVNAGADGAQWKAYLRYLAWIGNHTVPIRGERPNRGVYASDVIADIVARCAPGLTFTTGQGGSIEPSEYAIPHLTFREPMKGSDAILGVNAYHQRTWGVEDHKRFFWRSTEKPRKRWRIRRSKGHGIDLLGPQSESAINGLVVKFTDPAGVTRVVAPPGCSTADVTSELLADTSPTNPVNAAGITRKWGELQLGFVTDYNGAIQVGYAYFIDTLRFAASRGAVVVTGCVEDDETGILYPAWYMRAGDSAIVTDGDGIERRIIETTYDHDSRQLTANLDSTPHKVDALMERMGLALVGYVD